MTIEEYAKILDGIDHQPYSTGLYTNDDGKVGYFARYRVGDRFYSYSVSGTQERVFPAAVANAVRNGALTRPLRPYKIDGFEAALRYHDHSYMIAIGNSKP